MAPFQFPKPALWRSTTNYIRLSYYRRELKQQEYAHVDIAVSDMLYFAYNNFHEGALWQIIRTPNEPTRLKFLSYVPSVNTTWDS